VPVSLTPLQKEVYKSVLGVWSLCVPHLTLITNVFAGKNIEILRTLTSTSKGAENSSKKLKIGSMNNILMELRKCVFQLPRLQRTSNDLQRCIQHPYLVSRDIEPKGLSALEAHSRLITGSAKLLLLQALLPKLKARGHRVLLFSQVCIISHRNYPVADAARVVCCCPRYHRRLRGG
jgi:chromodomain-helicase-DNA-binding protein 4